MAVRGRSNADALLIVALAQGKTRAEAAEAACVSEHTVYRRLKDPAFVLQIEEAQAAIVGQAVGLLAAKTVVAVTTLGRLATQAEEPIQLKASLEILDRYPRMRDEHHAQVDRLESRASKLRLSEEALTMEQAMGMLDEAGANGDQWMRAYKLIVARMDGPTGRAFQAQVEVLHAQQEWESHRPVRVRRRLNARNRPK